MGWIDRYNWFAGGVIVTFFGLVNYGVVHPLFLQEVDEFGLPWVALCVVFGIVLKIYKQLVVDRRAQKVYKGKVNLNGVGACPIKLLPKLLLRFTTRQL